VLRDDKLPAPERSRAPQNHLNSYQALGDLILETAPVPGLGEVGFNGLITAISQQHGAKVADTFGALGAGDLVGGTDCLHPNKAGHTNIAAGAGRRGSHLGRLGVGPSPGRRRAVAQD